MIHVLTNGTVDPRLATEALLDLLGSTGERVVLHGSGKLQTNLAKSLGDRVDPDGRDVMDGDTVVVSDPDDAERYLSEFQVRVLDLSDGLMELELAPDPEKKEQEQVQEIEQTPHEMTKRRPKPVKDEAPAPMERPVDHLRSLVRALLETCDEDALWAALSALRPR